MDPSQLASEVGAFEKERLERLAAKPNTDVYTVKHDHVAEPWKVERVRAVFERIAVRMKASPVDLDDFVFRKQCLEEEEVLQFQRQHQKLFWLVTDRKKMNNEKYRNAIAALLTLRDNIEAGNLSDGQEADATATSVVMQALQS